MNHASERREHAANPESTANPDGNSEAVSFAETSAATDKQEARPTFAAAAAPPPDSNATGNAQPALPRPAPDDNETYGEAMKSKGGLSRVWRACTYSRDGFAEAFRHEHAVRQEIFLIAPLLVLALFLPVTWLETALLAGSLLLVLAVELLNSAIESCVDYISTQRHPLAKRAKDMGSAAVSLAILIAVLVWLAVLIPVIAAAFAAD